MKFIITGVVASFAAATLGSLAPAANADGAAHVTTVRTGDFVMSDTRANGHVDFLKDGLHVWTDGSEDTGDNGEGGTWNTDKAAEYFSVPEQGIPSEASLTWYGTSPQPGSQIMFDTDGDLSTQADGWNILVGEPVYGDDYWLTPSSDVYKNHHDLCPQTGDGFGGDCHGTLAQWQQALPDVTVYAAGFSLGSGIEGDGVIHDIRVGDTDYQFTNEPAVKKVRVTGDAHARVTAKAHYDRLEVDMVTDALGENEVEGAKLWFKVTDNDETVFHTRLGADDMAELDLKFAQGTGKHTIVISKGGDFDQKVVIRTGRQ
jgi:hypothetical protein